MKKRIISVILSALILLSAISVGAAAETTENDSLIQADQTEPTASDLVTTGEPATEAPTDAPT